MLKKGDVLFGLAVVIVLILILLLLFSVPDKLVQQFAIGSAALYVLFLIIVSVPIPSKTKPAKLREVPELLAPIYRLLQEAEENLEQDLQKSIRAYQQVRKLYSELEKENKKLVLRDIMRLYLKLLEKLHFKH